MGQKTTKIAEINSLRGFDLIVVFERKPQQFPLKVYKKWYEYTGPDSFGWHRKKINEFWDMVTAMRYMTGVISGQIKV